MGRESYPHMKWTLCNWKETPHTWHPLDFSESTFVVPAPDTTRLKQVHVRPWWRWRQVYCSPYRKKKREQSWQLPIKIWFKGAQKKAHQILLKQYEIPQVKAVFSGLRFFSLLSKLTRLFNINWVPAMDQTRCMRDLSSPTRDQPVAPAVEAWGLNHWTTREAPILLLFLKKRSWPQSLLCWVHIS